MDKCPKCGEELEYDEVDIGIGIQRGNPGCPNCYWIPEEIQMNDFKDDEEDDIDATDEDSDEDVDEPDNDEDSSKDESDKTD